ncbi:MAG: hypothetical protein JXB19_02460 [Bacteroidales bacterium]|nr:hypothetical protein [Bacteroidales bacterium]
MLKWYLTIALFITLSCKSFPQQWKLKRIEALFGIGTTNVYSDLGGAPNATNLLFIKDITFRSTRPSFYLGFRYRIDPKFTIKTSFIYGYSKTEDFTGSRNENRGFTSITQLFEFSGNLEYYLLPENRLLSSAAIFNRRGMINNYSSFALYVFTGVGATLYRSDLELTESRPGDEYKYDMGVTATFPLGLGIKYIISDDWIISYEAGYRQTLTDFLDGFKSPFSKMADIYWISSLNFSYRIPTTRRGLPVFLDRQWRRARF